MNLQSGQIYKITYNSGFAGSVNWSKNWIENCRFIVESDSKQFVKFFINSKNYMYLVLKFCIFEKFIKNFELLPFNINYNKIDMKITKEGIHHKIKGIKYSEDCNDWVYKDINNPDNWIPESVILKDFQKSNKVLNSKCLLCKSDGFMLFNSIECSNSKCRNYKE